MGAEEGLDLLIGLIARELEDHNFRIKELASIRIKGYQKGSVDDLIKLLEYENES